MSPIYIIGADGIKPHLQIDTENRMAKDFEDLYICISEYNSCSTRQDVIKKHIKDLFKVNMTPINHPFPGEKVICDKWSEVIGFCNTMLVSNKIKNIIDSLKHSAKMSWLTVECEYGNETKLYYYPIIPREDLVDLDKVDINDLFGSIEGPIYLKKDPIYDIYRLDKIIDWNFYLSQAGMEQLFKFGKDCAKNKIIPGFAICKRS